MTELVAVGLSHRSAAVEVRERLAVAPDRMPEALETLRRTPGVREAMLLCTCNRVEVYAVCEDAENALRGIRGYLETGAQQSLAEAIYTYVGVEAVRHIFRVAASLDSMVVGEAQILGQLKEAYYHANEAGTAGSLLSRCLHRAFRVAKRIRTETGIGRSATSIAAIAVELARTIFEKLEGRRVLLLGAGEMAELAARHLATNGATDLLVANRSPERARDVAQAVGGEPRDMADLEVLLGIADIVLSSTGAQTFILREEMVRRAIRARRHRPLFLIDIAVPRDVDPRAGEIDDVYLYNIDDLTRVAAENRAERVREAEVGEQIAATEAGELMTWLRSQEVVPTIVALREKLSAIAHAEAARAAAAFGPGDDGREAAETLAQAVVNKILHTPLTVLKRTAAEDSAASTVETVRRLFDLDAAPDVTGTAAESDRKEQRQP